MTGQATEKTMSAQPRHATPEAAPGFCLIEALMAATVLAIGIMGVVSMVLSASILDIRAHHLSRSSLVFESIVEHMARTQHDPAQYRNMTAPNGLVMHDGMEFGLNCTLTEGKPFAGCREMTCRITWNHSGKPYATRHAYTFAPK